MSITAFLSFILLTAFTPGPNNILSMTTGTRYGFRATLPLCFGMLAAFILIIAGSTVFSSLLYRVVPSAEPAMRALGALYILYLAWNVYRDKGAGSDADAAKKPGFAAGFLLQLVNAKFIFYCLTAMSTFILPNYSRPIEIAFFAVALVAASSLSNLLWALCGSAFQRQFVAHGRIINAVLALLLVYCALTLVIY